MTAPTLETRGLTKRFGGLTAVDDLSLSLPSGKLHAIIGPNGAGKTTLFNLVSGLLHPTSGDVYFRGRNITGLPAHEISRLGIKRTLQVKSVFARRGGTSNDGSASSQTAGRGMACSIRLACSAAPKGRMSSLKS